jgi:diguanylate cyclase (GGDEF)-like protein
MFDSFRSRAALAFGLLMAILTATLSMGLGALASRSALNDQGDSLHVLARTTAAAFAEGLYERMREVDLLTTSPMLTSDGQPDLERWRVVLTRMQATRPQFSWAGISDPDGKVLADTGGMLTGKSVAERPWFQAARKGVYVGDVHTAKLLASKLPPSVTGEPLRFLDFAGPLRNAQGQLVGVLGVHATWDWAHQLISTLRSPRARDRGIYVFILDHKAEVIHHPVGLKERSNLAPGQFLPREGAAALRWSDGHDYLTAIAPLPDRSRGSDLGWTIVVRQPMDMALASARIERERALSIGLAATGVAVVLVWLLAGRFSRPLARLTAAARSVAAGDLQAQIPVLSGSFELQQLSAALRGMRESLGERERVLETRVAERTAQLERLNAELDNLARKDGLTGLYNRRAADDRLAEELARHRRTGASLAVLLGDIDRFKAINDLHGHQIGDEVIKEVARRLAGVCRNTDFVARFGGEEFLVLMPETEPPGARIAAEKLRAAIEDEPIGGLQVTLSLGIAGSAEKLPDVATMLQTADQALYAAKAAGRNCVVMRGGIRADEPAGT